ncbi:MAG: hypothetical protein RQ751_07745 [Longimicrobiales bacterium]|nr:hypothetical protein [Longimicrobiales bacterium]
MARPRESETDRAWIWPVAITAGLLLVICVNAAFIWIAVSGADEVVPSYVTEER